MPPPLCRSSKASRAPWLTQAQTSSDRGFGTRDAKGRAESRRYRPGSLLFRPAKLCPSGVACLGLVRPIFQVAPSPCSFLCTFWAQNPARPYKFDKESCGTRYCISFDHKITALELTGAIWLSQTIKSVGCFSRSIIGGPRVEQLARGTVHSLSQGSFANRSFQEIRRGQVVSSTARSLLLPRAPPILSCLKSEILLLTDTPPSCLRTSVLTSCSGSPRRPQWIPWEPKVVRPQACQSL